ncbi:hypothetical protein ACWGBJ_31695 [Streptomyces sp. NPDC054951]
MSSERPNGTARGSSQAGVLTDAVGDGLVLGHGEAVWTFANFPRGDFT